VVIKKVIGIEGCLKNSPITVKEKGIVKNINMIDKIPSEIVNPILEVISYVFTAVLGWLAKWLQGNQSKKNKAKNE